MKKLANISGRQYDLLDVAIIGLDQGLSILFGPRSGPVRPSPGVQVGQDDTLDPAEKKRSTALLRVCHAGELCSQALYKGQALTARDPHHRSAMKLAALEEEDHLGWCEQRLADLDGRRSAFTPLWYLGSFAVGGLAGLLADPWNRGLVAESGLQVEKLLSDQLLRLPARDVRSHAILLRMQEEEYARRTAAGEGVAGAVELPVPARRLVGTACRLISLLASRV